MTYLIDSSRRVDWSTAGYPGGIPSGLSAGGNVLSYGALGNGTNDDTGAFNAAISAVSWSASSPKYLTIPAGTYLLTAEITIPSGCVLRGAGSDSTILNFNLSNANDATPLKMVGTESGSWTNITSGYTKRSKSISVSSASGLSVGDMIEIVQDNDSSMYTNSAWNESWADPARGDINVISTISGTTVTLAYGLPFTMTGTYTPRLQKLTPTKNAGVENLRIYRVDTSATNPAHYNGNIFMKRAYLCWIYRVESSYPSSNHFLLDRSLNCEIRQAWCHHARQYGAGEGYGARLIYRTARCLVADSCFYYLNSIVLAVGATSNVIAYNYSREAHDTRSPPYNNYDCEFHGHWANFNLIEGNVFEWTRCSGCYGPCPYNTFFRNRMTVREIWINDGSSYCNAIGNECNAPDGDIIVESSCTNVIQHANEIQNTVQYASGADTTLPASFAFSSQPTWWDGSYSWPAMGPDVRGRVIPAEGRYLSCQKVPQS